MFNREYKNLKKIDDSFNLFSLLMCLFAAGVNVCVCLFVSNTLKMSRCLSVYLYKIIF